MNQLILLSWVKFFEDFLLDRIMLQRRIYQTSILIKYKQLILACKDIFQRPIITGIYLISTFITFRLKAVPPFIIESKTDTSDGDIISGSAISLDRKYKSYIA